MEEKEANKKDAAVTTRGTHQPDGETSARSDVLVDGPSDSALSGVHAGLTILSLCRGIAMGTLL